MYMDARIRATGKKYGLLDEKQTMDLGLNRSFVRTFKVSKREAPTTLNLTLYSHSVLKRLKVVIKVYRRELFRKIESNLQRQIWLEQRGKQLLRKMLDESEQKAVQEKKKPPKNKRLLPTVDVPAMVENFYREYAPEKAGRAKAVVQHFEGRVDDMILSIELKYNVKFDENGRITSRSTV